MTDDFADQLAIRMLVESWAVWRDTGQWDKLRTTVHPGATMTATWFDGPFEDFIAHSAVSRAGGRLSQHVLGGTAVDLKGDRAIAQTRMTILVRGAIEGVEVDVACTGRFFDRVERRDSEWRIAKRDCIYEKSRLDPVPPGALVLLDEALLNSFPKGYCHLAYLQAQSGMHPNAHLPTGPELEALLESGYAWLRQ